MIENEAEQFAIANKEIGDSINKAAKECDKQNISLDIFLCELTAITVGLVFAKFKDSKLAKQAIDAFINYETVKYN